MRARTNTNPNTNTNSSPLPFFLTHNGVWPDKIKGNAASVCSGCKGLAGELEARLAALRDGTGELIASFEGIRQQERCLNAEIVR